MSKYGKLRKNAENFIIQDVYNNMTPEQYQKGIQIAVERTKKDLTDRYQAKFDSLVKEYNINLSNAMGQIIDTISIELLYELANQMNFWNLKEEDQEIKDSVKYRIQEIYENTMNSIKQYGKYKNDRQAEKQFEKKKKQIEKDFDIKF